MLNLDMISPAILTAGKRSNKRPIIDRPKDEYPLSGDMFGRNSVQRARLNTVPASHAHVLKYHGLFENTINLFNHFVRTG